MTSIYLIRHADNIKDDNINNFLLPLSISGDNKAKEISKLFNNINIVISSKYLRSISTVDYIAQLNNTKLIIDKRFNERKIGQVIDNSNYWIKQFEDDNYKFKYGESRKEVRERMLNGVTDILNKYEGNNIVIGTHGIAITFLLMNFCEVRVTDIDTKKRIFKFKDKIIMNDIMKKPDIFKLVFDNKKLISIERISYGI